MDEGVGAGEASLRGLRLAREAAGDGARPAGDGQTGRPGTADQQSQPGAAPLTAADAEPPVGTAGSSAERTPTTDADVSARPRQDEAKGNVQ